MVSSDIRDLLTAFSPSLDYFAISSGDGRIKIWDTVKGQLQTEFADITSSDAGLYSKPERGHLSVDYTCMKWLSPDGKKKRKLRTSLLVLGTGSGDVLSLDIAAGQLKWTVSDCHPGGVSAIAFSNHDSCIYTAGADGMFCKIDPQTGNILGKFKASTKAISSISVSPDGKILATAAAQLKTFNCSNHKKLQKFSGHPGAVRGMIFTEDGKYILSSAVDERYVALWSTDGGKKKSASCVLAMEHPAVFLDSKCLQIEGDGNTGLCVLAISEAGVCYTWYGQNIEELRASKPTKVALSIEDSLSKNQKVGLPTIFGAKLQSTAKHTAADMFIAYGLLVKPLFQKIVLQFGADMNLNVSQDGVLLPISQSLIKSKKGTGVHGQVTALDRANLEDALLPIAKISDLHEKRLRDKTLSFDSDDTMLDLLDARSQPESVENKVDMVEVEGVTDSMEKKLRELDILGHKGDSMSCSMLDLEANISQRKMRAAVMSLETDDASKLLESLVVKWQSRSCNRKYILPWIYCILVYRGHHIMAEEKLETQMLDALLKMAKSRTTALQPLLQLSGRLQLVTAQIDKASLNKTSVALENDQTDDDEDDEDIDEHYYGEDDDESQLSSDDDN
ncbi:transducin family protein / WD-40 repeat family protein [Euphorbia peplus]|nr:transducin family protein / WD-40 repeat family protein [Euphorbia peplus]